MDRAHSLKSFVFVSPFQLRPSPDWDRNSQNKPTPKMHQTPDYINEHFTY